MRMRVIIIIAVILAAVFVFESRKKMPAGLPVADRAEHDADSNPHARGW